MKRTTARLLVAGLSFGSLGLGFVPLAAAAPAQQRLTPVVESWYQPDPTCALPAGCVAVPALPAQPPVAIPAANPYPTGTLHVSVSGGQETARSYLAFDLPLEGTLTSAALTVPLDVDVADGSAQPETAKVQVCLVTDPIAPAEASTQTPPAVDCAATARATYQAMPEPHLQADLKPLLAGLPTTFGIALLPDGTDLQPSDAWHVTFSSAARSDEAKTPPATLAITVEAADTPLAAVPDTGGTVTADPPAFDSGSTSFAGPPVDSSPVFTADAPLIDSAPAAEVPAVSAPEDVQVADVALPQTITVGYAYPAVWLLPLILLVVLPLVLRTLTQDLTPARPEAA